MDKYKILRFVLENQNLTSLEKSDFFDKCNIGHKESYRLIMDIMERRTTIMTLARDHRVFNCRYFRVLLMLCNYRFRHENISDEDFDEILTFILANKKLSISVLNRMVPLLDSSHQIERIRHGGYLVHPRTAFNITRRCLEIKDFEYYKKLVDVLDFDNNTNKKLEALFGHYTQSTTTSDIEIIFSEIEGDYYRDYFSVIKPFWNEIPESRNFIEIRSNPKKFDELKHLIVNSLLRREGFAFVRLSDGESYGFTDDESLSKRQEQHWWGSVLTLELRQKIKEDFRNYLSSTTFDFIGVPTIHKYVHYIGFNNSGFNSETELDKKVIHRLSFMNNELDKLAKSEQFESSKICEDQINNYIFDLDYFYRLSRSAKRVVFISGYNTSVLENITEHFEVEKIFIEIPTHNLLTMRDDTVSSELPLPYSYSNIIESLKNIISPGDLCLISAGFIGKMFIAECKTQGGVAIDIGQVLGGIVNGSK